MAKVVKDKMTAEGYPKSPRTGQNNYPRSPRLNQPIVKQVFPKKSTGGTLQLPESSIRREKSALSSLSSEETGPIERGRKKSEKKRYSWAPGVGKEMEQLGKCVDKSLSIFKL